MKSQSLRTQIKGLENEVYALEKSAEELRATVKQEGGGEDNSSCLGCVSMCLLAAAVLCLFHPIGWLFAGMFFLAYKALGGDTNKPQLPSQAKLQTLESELNKRKSELSGLMNELENALIEERLEAAKKAILSGDSSPTAKMEYVEAARAYHKKLRTHILNMGGNLKPEDELKIQTDLQSLLEHKPSIIEGDYIDNSSRTFIDKVDNSTSNQTVINNSTQIENAVIDIELKTEASITRAIVRQIKQDADNGSSFADLIAAVSAPQERIRECLEKLQVQGLVIIGNRSDGVIVYRLDELG